MAYICDTEGNILFLNKVFEKMSGHKPEEFIGKSFAPLFDEENLKKAMELYTRTLKGESLKQEVSFKDTGVLCEYKNIPLRDKKGVIIGVLGTARDITERKQADEELRQNKQFLKNIFDGIQDGISVLDKDLNIIQVNEAMQRQYSSVMPIQGKKCYQVYQGISEPCTICPTIRSIEKGTLQVDVVPLYGPKGKKGWQELYAYPLKDEKGNITGVIEHIRDITERKHLENELLNINKSLEQRVSMRTKEWAKANEALQIKITQQNRTEEILRKSEEKYSRLIENLQENYFFYSHNTEGVFTYLSPAITNILGYAPKEFLTHYSEYLTDSPSNKKVIRHTDLSIKGIKQPPYEFELFHKDGTRRILKVQEVPVFDTNRNVIAVEGIAEDITESKRAEEKLVTYQTQLKRLSSTLSLTEERERRRISEDLHDRIGQALTVIKMKLEELRNPQNDTDSDLILKETGDLLDNAIQDTRTLTFEISPPLLYELGFEPTVEWLIEQFRERHNILIDYEGNGGGRILDDDVTFFLFKSVRELLFNAIKHARAEKIKVSVQREKDVIRISIEDNGVGFDFSKVQFSVNDLSGFGLFSIRERMEHFGGNLEVISQPGKGTHITLTMSLKPQEVGKDAKR